MQEFPESSEGSFSSIPLFSGYSDRIWLERFTYKDRITSCVLYISFTNLSEFERIQGPSAYPEHIPSFSLQAWCLGSIIDLLYQSILLLFLIYFSLFLLPLFSLNRCCLSWPGTMLLPQFSWMNWSL